MFIKFLKNSIFILCVSFASGAALAAPDMFVDTVSGSANSTVTVPIRFENGTGTNAASSMLVRVNFDAGKLAFVSGTSTGLVTPVAGSFLTDSFSASASGNVVTIQAIRIPSQPFPNGTINLQFTINSMATGAVAITLQPATTAETFKNTSLNPIPATSTNFGTVAAATAVAGAVNVTPPNIPGTVNITPTGTPEVGRTLTANVTDDNGITGTISYEWFANGAAIAEAVAATYTPTADDVGKVITVRATYTDRISTNRETPVSSPTAAVTLSTTPTPGMVTITGTPQVGQTLTANVTDANGIAAGAITPASYAWSAGGVPRATGSTYVPTTDDVGKVITVQVTYTDQIGTPETPSASTSVVASAPVTTSNPANIPVFGPFGLLAVLAGLLWFGGRRRKS